MAVKTACIFLCLHFQRAISRRTLAVVCKFLAMLVTNVVNLVVRPHCD